MQEEILLLSGIGFSPRQKTGSDPRYQGFLDRLVKTYKEYSNQPAREQVKHGLKAWLDFKKYSLGIHLSGSNPFQVAPVWLFSLKPFVRLTDYRRPGAP